jgi:2-aminophenol/2-amino-5-chlorophenol 1,6-dioxygenase alpha subunit
MSGAVVGGYIVPGMPQPLLVPERSPGWASLRASFEVVRREIESTDADLLLLYSTQWTSVIGHQVQADPEPEWVLVDQEWHALGSMPYRLRMDAEFAHAYAASARARGLHARTVAYRGFPIDTGTVVALRLLDPDNRRQACVVSCNMYADRGETLVLGKAAADAVGATGRRAIAIAVTTLSNRLFTEPIDPAHDRISSLKDDEWNRKILEILGEGRLEDVSQLAREFALQANADQKMKAIWWLAATMGQHNRYDGRVFDYQPVWGTGCALVGIAPTTRAAADQEFDEEDVDVYVGDRNVLSAAGAPAAAASESDEIVRTKTAPRPVGAYAHARRVGDLVFVAGVGPRDPATDAIPGGPVRDAQGRPRDYDVEAQTRACIDNVRRILEDAGSSLERILDVTVFLIDMDRDFAAFNRVWAEVLGRIGATRTTLAVTALPTPIAVELKVIAAAGSV